MRRPYENGLIARARTFSIAAHTATGQKRKYTNEPYMVHPLAVAAIVASVRHTAPMIAAALLHDVVEDTHVSIEIIAAEFGSVVTRMVSDLSSVSIPEHGSRAQRKAIDREHTRLATPESKTIKLADIIDNISGFQIAFAHDPDFASQYLTEKIALLDVLGEGDALLFSRAEYVLRTARQHLESSQ